MATMPNRIEKLLTDLEERTKELNCIYKIEETLQDNVSSLDNTLIQVLQYIPGGFQYPATCAVKLTLSDRAYVTENYENDTPWQLSASILVQNKVFGELTIFYLERMPEADIGPFLKEEKKLLETIVDRLGHYILHYNLRNVFEDIREVRHRTQVGEWRVNLDMMRKTDPNLFMSLLRKLLYQLSWQGIDDADRLLKQSVIELKGKTETYKVTDENRPLRKMRINNYDDYIEAILKIADENMHDKDILEYVEQWILEDRSIPLVRTLESQGSSLADIADAIRRYFLLAPEKVQLSEATIKSLRVSLLRRFFTPELNYIRMAKEYVKLTDFKDLIDKMIFVPDSHGKMGGKSSGVFLAKNILEKSAEEIELLQDIKIPKTWYVASDTVIMFMQYNNLDEVLEQKYKEIDEVRLSYEYIVQLFKNSSFPPDVVKGLSMALDDFGDVPLVVRSSSLLEDQLGAAFSGKYKSLFLANQGSKEERLNALMDAIAEVYASTFGPDPIEYRAERDLLDFHEEMGIMIMEVVGERVGRYFFPAFAGVAFSRNEFRWSPRIKREDGLVRLVPGLGTRAVDRVADDYPILIAPGQPNLRVNVSVQEKLRYTPRYIDVINLKTNAFETVDADKLVKEFGEEYPGLFNFVSIIDGKMMRQPVGFELDTDHDDVVFTFDGLINRTSFIKRVHIILQTLEKKLQTPVDIEFASDGKDLYLLQCRPQSYAGVTKSEPVPRNIDEERKIFSAKKYVSYGQVPDITHLVYVDPVAYGEIEDEQDLKLVGKAVGKLNNMLPKRKFILVGPGRWGSRGDIKLGVNVTYSQINNTAMLVEVARKTGGYMPDLSFGTHFFQDLVEASIRYLPLYPDDPGISFNEHFLLKSENLFTELLPEYKHLEKVIRVIDVLKITDGHILRVIMDADNDEALAFISKPSGAEVEQHFEKRVQGFFDWSPTMQWRWRHNVSEKMAELLDPDEYGVKGLYLFGSTKHGTAEADSDIDLIVHVEDDKEKRQKLETWFNGWSLSLAAINSLRTGKQMEHMLDIRYITDDDIRNKNSFATKIHAATNAAEPLPLRKKKKKKSSKGLLGD